MAEIKERRGDSSRETSKQPLRCESAVSALVLGILCLAAGCTKQMYVPVERTVRDTVREVRERVDTFMHRDSVHIVERGDTVIREVYRWRIRTRLKTDTVYKTKLDSVPVVPKVAVEKPRATPTIKRIMGHVITGLRVIMLLVILLMILKWRKK